VGANGGLANPVILGYLFVGLFALLVLRRAYWMMKGTPVRYATLIFLPIFYVLIYAVELSGVLYAGLSSSISGEAAAALSVDVALVLVGVLVAYRYVQQHVELFRPEGANRLYYRLSPLLPIVYVALFVVRVAIGAAILNESPFAFPTPAAIVALSPALRYVFFAVDAVWGFSTGLLLGRSAGVVQTTRRQESTASAPLA
jgi:hypothetical protein